MNKNNTSGIDISIFTEDIYHQNSDTRFSNKYQFKKNIAAYEFHQNNLIAEFARFGLFMLENGTRKKSDPTINTMYKYISLIKPISLLLEDTNLLSLNDFELCSLFEQVQELKGNNKTTNSALLNLFTYLNKKHGMSLIKMNLAMVSTENVDTNLLWDWEVYLILQSDELSEFEKLFIMILFEVGPRITEVYQLIGDDIDTIGDLLHFRTNRFGKMKNRFSTRCISFNHLSDELVDGLKSHALNKKNAIFDVDDEQNEQRDFSQFCLRINTVIKKVTGRNVSLKHFRHSKARTNFLVHDNETSLRIFYQDAGHMGHSNLSTSQKHYIQSVYEKNILIEENDKDTAVLSDVSSANVRQWRCRYLRKKAENKMNENMLNAYLSMEYIKKTA